jgi:hypothetical protein
MAVKSEHCNKGIQEIKDSRYEIRVIYSRIQFIRPQKKRRYFTRTQSRPSQKEISTVKARWKTLGTQNNSLNVDLFVGEDLEDHGKKT